MRLVIHPGGEEPIAFEYTSREDFIEDLWTELDKFVELSIADRRCTTTVCVNGLCLKVKYFIENPAGDNPCHDIRNIYKLKEWFKCSSLKPEGRY